MRGDDVGDGPHRALLDLADGLGTGDVVGDRPLPATGDDAERDERERHDEQPEVSGSTGGPQHRLRLRERSGCSAHAPRTAGIGSDTFELVWVNSRTAGVLGAIGSSRR